MRSLPQPARAAAKACVASVAALALVYVGGAVSVSAAPAPAVTGFNPTNAGTVKYQRYAPTEATRPSQINAPFTQKQADRLAAAFGFDKDKAFSKKQYAAFLAAQGRPSGFTQAEANKAAELTRKSVTYLTNTTGNTYTRIIDGATVTVNVGSYGLIVNQDGLLESPANSTSPVRQINWVLAPDPICDYPDLAKEPPPGVPCGYMGAWMRSNNARDTLKELYASAYPGEAIYGSKSQDAAGIPQLVLNERANGSTATIGMAMAPSIWIANFLLIYALNPQEAAKMPAYWAAIPEEAAAAIEASETGQVPYSDFMDLFAD